MKTLVIIWFSLISMLCIDKANNEVKVEVKEGSFLYIKGTSNVNTFTCDYLQPITPKTYTIIYDKFNKGWQLDKAQLNLKSTAFDCGGRGINRDFKELINANQHPFISIKVRKINCVDTNYQGVLDISIADKTESIPVQISEEQGSPTTYKSTLKLNIKDFGLETPTKMMGLIKVHEEILIHVNLNLEIVQS